MISGSSGIYGENSSEVIDRNREANRHILEQVNYENTGSINIEEIKYYERHSPIKQATKKVKRQRIK